MLWAWSTPPITKGVVAHRYMLKMSSSKQFSFAYPAVAALLLSFAAGGGVRGQECSLRGQLQAMPQANLSCQVRSAAACDGLVCFVVGGAIDGTTATFAVQKCLDPVSVSLNLTQTAGMVNEVLQYFFTESGSKSIEVDGGNSTVSVVMDRNATHLCFEAYAELSPAVTPPLSQPVSVPLQPAVCMCASLRSLATRIDSPLEHDCVTIGNPACNGVRCELDVFGSVFYVETIVLPCTNSVELVVRDSNMEAIHTDVFNKTEVRVIMVDILPLLVDVEITVKPYSMLVRATLTDPIFGETEIIPAHNITLDRTACDIPDITTVLPPVFTERPTIVPSRGASQTCLAFYALARDTSEPFVCWLLEDCDGLSCRLDIQATSYSLAVQALGCAAKGQHLGVSATLREKDGNVLVQAKSAFEYTLPDPNSVLTFTSTLYNNTHLGMELTISVNLFPFPSRTTTLIAYTVIPLDCPKSGLSSSEVAAVASVVPIAVLLIAVLLTVVVVWGSCMLLRHKGRVGQFNFKPMSFNELRNKDTADSTPAANTAATSAAQTTDMDKEDMKEDLGSSEAGKHE